MKRSFLENLLNVIEDESTRKSIIDSIISENGNDINAEKQKTESIKNELTIKENLINELNTKIKDNESLDLDKIKQDEYNRGKEDGSKEFDEFKKNSALKNSITGVKDVDYVISKLDQEKIKYEKNENGDYTISGLDEQLKEIKEKHSFIVDEPDNNNLFQVPQVNLGGNHETVPQEGGFNFNFAGVRPQENKK